jgi:hypothetical protein
MSSFIFFPVSGAVGFIPDLCFELPIESGSSRKFRGVQEYSRIFKIVFNGTHYEYTCSVDSSILNMEDSLPKCDKFFNGSAMTDQEKDIGNCRVLSVRKELGDSYIFLI